jgi:glycerol-3-phosphate dehydrogenase
MERLDILMEHIIVIGGGGTGGALAYDLALRGFGVTLFEKGEFLSGTTGRHHGLLHSGARYAVSDARAARECVEENRILRRIAPQSLEANDGLFVALTEEDLAYGAVFPGQCEACGIRTTVLKPGQALAMEPALNPGLLMAVQVPDASMDPWRLALRFFSSAKALGARINHFSQVVGLSMSRKAVTGVNVLDHRSGKRYMCPGDIIVNATGAWAGTITRMAGIADPVQPGPGVIVAVEGRITDMVINRLHPPSTGDIIVPQRNLTILGTSLWLADDPDNVEVPREHAAEIVSLCSRMVPSLASRKVTASWSACRPLIRPEALVDDPQGITRSFSCFDHGALNGIRGLVSVTGGKATTARAIAEKTADLICRMTGRDIPCRTADRELLAVRNHYG